MQRVAVVIPTHKEQLDELEKISLTQCRKVLGHYPLVFVAPEGKTFSYFEQSNRVVQFAPECFQSLQTYNRLMLSPQFYEPFLDYEYILIYHTDAFVFYDALEYFCSLGYDYIGAPWPLLCCWYKISHRKNLSRVGNGGFCLRKVKTHYDLLTNHSDSAQRFRGNEDNFFSICGNNPALGFNVAPYAVACKFAAEVNPAKIIKKNGGHFPFGAHKWWGYSGGLFIDFFLRLGYDLRPLKNRLRNLNYVNALRQALHEEAMSIGT